MPKKLSGMGGVPPPFTEKNPLSSFWKPPFKGTLEIFVELFSCIDMICGDKNGNDDEEMVFSVHPGLSKLDLSQILSETNQIKSCNFLPSLNGQEVT